MPERRDHGLLEGDRTAGGPGPQWLSGGYFPPALRAFASRSKIAAPQPSSAGAPALRVAPGAGPLRPPSGDRHEGRDGRGRSGKGPPPMTDHDDIEPSHASSTTDLVLNELQLFGYRPFEDQPDPRPLPEGKTIAGAVADIFDALVATLNDTRLEPDLPDLLWSTVNLFHRAADRINGQLDDNEQAQRKSQREQDGSEVRSVELERLTAEGITLIERRNCLELFRDQATERFEVHTGSSWRPRSGSLVNHRTLTAAMIDSRDFIAAKRRADTEVMLPAGPKVALTGGLDFNDHQLIWDRLDKGRRTDCLQMGDCPEGAADRVQTGLDEARQGSPVQAQRRHARTPADRRHAFPGHGNPGQPRRQGEAPGHSCLEVRRRISAACSFSDHQVKLHRRNSASFRFYIQTCAAVVVEGAAVTPLQHGSHHHARPRTTPQHHWHWSALLADLHVGSVCFAILCGDKCRHVGLAHWRGRARRVDCCRRRRRHDAGDRSNRFCHDTIAAYPCRHCGRV